jgi:hypothetical protein
MNWIFKRILGGIALAILAVLLFGYGTMYLWNWLMPDLFHLAAINFYQAIGLVILSKILFGGIRMRGGGHGWGYRKYWKAKWENMTPEEREKFKTEFGQRCRSKWGNVEVKVEKSE